MKRSLLIPLVLATPLVLAGCDDGSERITALEQELKVERTGVETTRGELEKANARIVELEKSGGDSTQYKADLDAANMRIKELEEAGGDTTKLQADLDAANTRIQELEAAGGADVKVQEELDAANMRIKELETAGGDTTKLQADLDAANTRIKELEAAGTTATAEAPDLQTTVGEPMKAVVVRLQDYQSRLTALEGTVGDNDAAVTEIKALRKDLGEIGRDLSTAADGAGVVIE